MTTMSPTLIRAAVLVFSGRLVVVFVSATAVGASLTSVTVRLTVSVAAETESASGTKR